ncbi:MAG: hypothetical protein A3K19_32240 [Lentisphaerae bacterium RIFOXYB12_FULL_65_16]|nr:MAG: hypothetical protein A3K18_17785 [Lentisphaerae bacterium RIFOXYA12_64_32]OGV90132.1 MAG: hypothetical protein A3K19_32240 [Lentisphaerae bacterium RIFOXYB12_FULL_65_16]
MNEGALGRLYEDGETVVNQGEVGNCMHVVQSGQVAVLIAGPGGETQVGTLGTGDVFGEMALFTGEPRTATIRAQGRARILTVDKRQFLRRAHEDPSLAFSILHKMAHRIKELNLEVVRLKGAGAGL